MIFCPARFPLTTPSISAVLPGPPLSIGGTFFIVIDGAESDLDKVQAPSHKIQMVKKRSLLFPLIENFIETLVFDPLPFHIT